MTTIEGKAIAVRHARIDEEAAGQRIDNYLLRIAKGVPKSHLYRILRSGEVRGSMAAGCSRPTAWRKGTRCAFRRSGHRGAGTQRAGAGGQAAAGGV